ncbi:MAG TPA: hypothetical protein VKU60_05000, partial [Chloroflexota bacterium]|nr:hypothetical protein [Chloroflexota bacterium]
MSVQIAELPAEALTIARSQADSEQSLRSELNRRLAPFDFQEGALLVEIPQVPLHLIEPEV